MKEDKIDYKIEAIEKLKKLTKSKFVHITKSGDHAIKTSFKVLKDLKYDLINVQDQGGWMNYEKLAEQNKLKVRKIKTDYGVISKEETTKQRKAVILAEPAGYFATQKNIHGIRKHTNFLILDICGSIGKSYIRNFKADIYLGSFNRWKPVNIGLGGFISTDNEEINSLIEKNLDKLDSEFDSKFYEDLYNKLKFLSKRYKELERVCKKIKKDLSDYKILHSKDEGINVVVKFGSETEKKEILEYCKKEKLEYTECPRYIRVLDNAISIEVKRL